MESWLQRRLDRISLREFHFYTIVFILLFTVIFSSLLIYDEYKGFAKTVHLEVQVQNENNITQPPALTHAAIKGRLIKIVLEISTLALILFGFIVGISKIANSMIARDMERFLEFFESTREKSRIDSSPLSSISASFAKWRGMPMRWH